MHGKIILQHGCNLTCFLFSLAVEAQTLTNTLDSKGTGRSEPSFTPIDKEAVRGHFQLTEFTMQPGELDQAIVFKNPANEQTMLFDLAEGGTIVSFRYRDIEHMGYVMIQA